MLEDLFLRAEHLPHFQLITSLHSASWPCWFHILSAHTHSQMIDSNQANTTSQKSSSQLTLPSTSHSSGCCPAITSCENILHRWALFPPPTVLREMPYKGVGKSSFIHFKETHTTPPAPSQKIPSINPKVYLEIVWLFSHTGLLLEFGVF